MSTRLKTILQRFLNNTISKKIWLSLFFLWRWSWAFSASHRDLWSRWATNFCCDTTVSGAGIPTSQCSWKHEISCPSQSTFVSFCNFLLFNFSLCLSKEDFHEVQSTKSRVQNTIKMQSIRRNQAIIYFMTIFLCIQVLLAPFSLSNCA